MFFKNGNVFFSILIFKKCLTHSKYDHYCPWLLVSIGERTHRFFICFLLSNIIASCTLAYNALAQMFWRISVISPRVHWEQSKFKNALITLFILSRTDLWMLALFFVLTVIAFVLTMFLFQQLYYISKNITQIELDKYDMVKEEMIKNKINTPIINKYSKGFWGNWKAFIFPPKVEKHQPMEYFIENKTIKSRPKGQNLKVKPSEKKKN